MNIGIFGAGTVGSGLIEILRESGRFNIAGVVDRSYHKKKKSILKGLPVSDDPEFLLKNDDIDVYVELLGGTTTATYVAREVIEKGRVLVTANKALLAEHGYSLFEKASRTGARVGFEAAVAGAIPVIRNLNTVFAFEPVNRLQGILNGTTNYILSAMRTDGKDYNVVLREAQALGLAEADPTLDVNGMDATHKLALMASLISGRWIDYSRISTRGIEDISLTDIVWADNLGYRIKLLASIFVEDDGMMVAVEPVMVGRHHFLYEVEMEDNAVFLQGEWSGSHLLVGKGAGSLPTAYSVYSDIISLGEHKLEDYVSRQWQYGTIKDLREQESSFYLRLEVEDRPGVLARLSEVLGRHKVSIFSVHQDNEYTNQEKGTVDQVLIIQKSKRHNLETALNELLDLKVVEGHAFYMPIEQVR